MIPVQGQEIDELEYLKVSETKEMIKDSGDHIKRTQCLPPTGQKMGQFEHQKEQR